jgi:O-acetyl-ADP-ribose deacetylase (regulator of RNase III)
MTADVHNRLRAVQADITSLRCDAIVNAANAALMPGGGVDGEIRAKGGIEMDAALYRIGRCEPGHAVVTPGFALPARYVIHAVAPIWSPGEKREALEGVLARCYESALGLADEHDIRTIAFPAIGTGAFGWPADRAAQIAVDSAVAHLRRGGRQSEITFCCFSAADLARYETLIAGLT